MNGVLNTKIARFFIDKFPSSKNILSVYAVIVFLIYSWTLLVSFYKFPSWILSRTVNQIAAIYAYAFLVNLAESISALILILLLDFTLFIFLRNRDEFQARTTALALTLLISTMWRLFLFQDYVDSSAFVSGELVWWAATALIGIPLAVLASKVAPLKSFFEGIAERTIIFLYIYLPLSFVSLIIVVARNIY